MSNYSSLFQFQQKVDPLQPLTDNIEPRWHQPWSEPSVKVLIGLNAALQTYQAFTPQNLAVSGTGNLLWCQPWSWVMSKVALIGEG